MDVDLLARRVGIRDDKLVGKARELVRLASMKVTGGLGQVGAGPCRPTMFDCCAYCMHEGHMHPFCPVRHVMRDAGGAV